MIVTGQQPGPQLLLLDPLLQFLQDLGLQCSQLTEKTLAASSSVPGIDAGGGEGKMQFPVCLGRCWFVLALLHFTASFSPTFGPAGLH